MENGTGTEKPYDMMGDVAWEKDGLRIMGSMVGAMLRFVLYGVYLDVLELSEAQISH